MIGVSLLGSSGSRLLLREGLHEFLWGLRRDLLCGLHLGEGHVHGFSGGFGGGLLGGLRHGALDLGLLHSFFLFLHILLYVLQVSSHANPYFHL